MQVKTGNEIEQRPRYFLQGEPQGLPSMGCRELTGTQEEVKLRER